MKGVGMYPVSNNLVLEEDYPYHKRIEHKRDGAWRFPIILEQSERTD